MFYFILRCLYFQNICRNINNRIIGRQSVSDQHIEAIQQIIVLFTVQLVLISKVSRRFDRH